MRLIDIEPILRRKLPLLVMLDEILSAPSIDLVRCGECKWAKANGAYQWCGRLDSTARITANDFCSYGERKTDNEEFEEPNYYDPALWE